LWLTNVVASGYGERLPYNQSDLRSVFHTRSFEVFKLSQVCVLPLFRFPSDSNYGEKMTRPIDIFLSHDWPRDITKYGDERGLLRRKSFLKEDINNNRFGRLLLCSTNLSVLTIFFSSLGNPALRDLLFQLKPSNWFSAHMHVRFTAEVM